MAFDPRERLTMDGEAGLPYETKPLRQGWQIHILPYLGHARGD
ncbi:MAG: hypothetical protein DHS20C11_26690 [Lysobacteraceae bacterium]|nr:MAG: hypothetical protein DHS20C11_26690 [Xanthomonadaceae bacterium]